jgi:hypothetical protein
MDTTMANKFETFLSKVGAEVKKIASYAVTKVLPEVTKIVVDAEPVEDVVLDLAGLSSIVPEFNTVASAALSVEQAAAILPAGMTSAAKFAAVFAAVQADLLPKLEALGLTSEAATAKLNEYIQAVITTINTFSAATTTTSATAAAAKTAAA